MFPRGVSNLEEVPQDYVSRCLVRPLEHSASPVDELLSEALDVVAHGDVG